MLHKDIYDSSHTSQLSLRQVGVLLSSVFDFMTEIRNKSVQESSVSAGL